MPEVCENRNHQVVIGVSFVSDWLRHWHKTFRRIIEQSKAKQMQSQITFDNQCENCSLVYIVQFW